MAVAEMQTTGGGALPRTQGRNRDTQGGGWATGGEGGNLIGRVAVAWYLGGQGQPQTSGTGSWRRMWKAYKEGRETNRRL